MGGYLLLNIEFKDKEDRDIFEKKFKVKRILQYKYDGNYDCYYYPKYMGYAEPEEMIKKCKIDFVRFLSIDISTNSNWFNELKQESFNNEDDL